MSGLINMNLLNPGCHAVIYMYAMKEVGTHSKPDEQEVESWLCWRGIFPLNPRAGT